MPLQQTYFHRTRFVWFHGVFLWGLPAAILWCALMWVAQSDTDLREEIAVALSIFPTAGYLAGRMMWRDRLRAEQAAVSTDIRATGPHAAVVAAADEVEPTWNRTLEVWWALTWRSVLAMLASGVVVAALATLVATASPATGIVGDLSSGLAQVLGGILGVVASIVPVKLILGKDFGQFRLVLLAKTARPGAAADWRDEPELGSSAALVPPAAGGPLRPEPGPSEP